jgi:hypothetical protein
MTDTTMFLVNNFGSMMLIFWAFFAFMIIGVLFVVIRDNNLYNKKVRVFKLSNGKSVCYDTKGGIVKDKNGVPSFKTKLFGEDNQKIHQNVPPFERFYHKQQHMFNFGLFPYVIKECVDFLNVKEGVYVPISHSFITLKRGQDLNICSQKECQFCEFNVNIEDFRKEPSKYVKQITTPNNMCEKCLSEFINARYEGIDSADLSFYWSKIEEIEKRWGDWFTKYGVMIVSLACLILVGFVTYFIFKYSGPMFSDVNSAKMSAESSIIAQQIQAQQYNNTLPIN